MAVVVLDNKIRYKGGECKHVMYRIRSSPIYVELELRQLHKRGVCCEVYPTMEIAKNAADPDSDYYTADREKCLGGVAVNDGKVTWWMDPVLTLSYVGEGVRDNLKR